MSPSLVNSYDIFMMTASAVMLKYDWIVLSCELYKKSFVLPSRVSLSPKSVVSDVDAGLELMTPSRARVHHLCPAGPHYLGSSRHYTEIVKLIPAPAPRPHIAAHNPARNLI